MMRRPMNRRPRQVGRMRRDMNYSCGLAEDKAGGVALGLVAFRREPHNDLARVKVAQVVLVAVNGAEA